MTIEKEKTSVEQKEEYLKSMIQEIGETFEENPEIIAEALAFGSQFYQYSMRNSMLIYNQNKHSQYVQSFQKWKEMGASVKRGEHGMNIFVPVQTTYLKVGEEEFVQLRYATKVQKEAYQKGEVESVNRLHFRIGTVFDISQTTFPKERYPELFQMGYANEKYSTLIDGLTKFCDQELSCPVEITDVKSIGLRGCYYPELHKISLNQLLEDSERLSTLTHEMGHALIHHDPEAMRKSEALREFEADAVSIMLQTHYGVEITDTRKRHLATAYQKLKEIEPDTQINDCLNDVFQVYRTHVEEIDRHVQESIDIERGIENAWEEKDAITQELSTKTPMQEMLDKEAEKCKHYSRNQEMER